MQRGFFDKAYTKRDSNQKSQVSSDKPKSLNMAKEAAKKTKAAETKSPRSEVGPKYLTDKGSPIPIKESPKPIYSPTQKILNDLQMQLLFKDKGKQISGSDSSYNCHSYVFTDGKAGWISNTATVEKIIKENGFQEIASATYGSNDYTYTQLPKEGDIIIYRDKNNAAVHSGIIFKSDKDPKNIIVKSKPGEYGIFKHSIALPDVSEAFEVTHWEIYHTDRPQGRIITETSS